MTSATLTITLPEHVWVAQISRDFPEANFRVLNAIPGDDVGFALLRIDSDAVDEILDEMAEHPQLTSRDVIYRQDSMATVHFETTHPLLLLSAKHSGITLELPVDIQNGRATVDVTGNRARLSELGKQLEKFGLDYEIKRIEASPLPEQVLSDRQAELLRAALEAGYYDTPRETSLTELAEGVGIAKSTCSEILQRAEGAVIKEFLQNLPGETESPHNTE